MKFTKKYKIKEVKKDINIFKNGHGIISYDFKTEVLSTKFDSVSFIFGIDDWTRRKISLKPFKIISSTPLSQKNSEQTFSISFKKKVDYKIRCIKDTDTLKEIKITFPKNKFRKGDIIEFSYIWSCPLLYLDTEEVKEISKGIISALIVLVRRCLIEKIIHNIYIEKGHPLARKVFEYEIWENSKKQIATVPLIKKGGELKVEIKNIKLGYRYLFLFRNK